MKIEIQAMETQISEEEIRQNLPKEVLEKVKGKKLIPYIIAHEGESKPKVLAEGTSRILRWPRAVIRRAAEKIKDGAKFFIAHGKDNSLEGRESVGEVIGSFVKETVNGLQAIALGVLTDKAKDMDVCSIEANIHESGGIVGDINDISGIALGSSDKDSPAFPGARRLAAIQCFSDDTGGDPDKEIPGEGRDKMPTFGEIKQAVKDLNIYPNQLFTEEDIKADRKFGKVYDERDSFKTKAETAEKERDDIKKKSEDAVKANEKATATERLEKMLPDGLTEKQKSFIKRNFNPEKIEDLSDDGLNGFVENAQKEFAEYAKIFGVAEDGPSGGSGDGESEEDPVEAAIKKTTEGDS